MTDATKRQTLTTEEKGMNEATENGRPVVVTTEHRGVFFGYANDTSGNVIKLRHGRNCVYWSSDLRGFMGLAALGPSESCKVGPAADIELRGVTAVVDATPEAVERWEAAPW